MKVRGAMGVGLVLGMIGWVSPAQAQIFGNNNDPFTIYYGFWLPRQAALAVTPRPEQTVNAMAAIRQQTALTERGNLYDPIQPFGAGLYDPANPFGNRRAGQRLGGRAIHGGNSSGAGPSMYYNRSAAYFPGSRSGRGTNAAVAVGGSPTRRNYGSIGMPNASINMPSMGYAR